MHITGKREKEPKSTSFRTLHWTCFRNVYLTLDEIRGVVHQVDPVVKGVCAKCNNDKLSEIDDYAKNLIGQYSTRRYAENDKLEIEFDYVMIQKMLIKYAFNDLRSRSESCSFFDDKLLHFFGRK